MASWILGIGIVSYILLGGWCIIALFGFWPIMFYWFGMIALCFCHDVFCFFRKL